MAYQIGMTSSSAQPNSASNSLLFVPERKIMMQNTAR